VGKTAARRGIGCEARGPCHLPREVLAVALKGDENRGPERSLGFAEHKVVLSHPKVLVADIEVTALAARGLELHVD
jgi:hypothetical protein